MKRGVSVNFPTTSKSFDCCLVNLFASTHQVCSCQLSEILLGFQICFCQVSEILLSFQIRFCQLSEILLGLQIRFCQLSESFLGFQTRFCQLSECLLGFQTWLRQVSEGLLGGIGARLHFFDKSSTNHFSGQSVLFLKRGTTAQRCAFWFATHDNVPESVGHTTSSGTFYFTYITLGMHFLSDCPYAGAQHLFFVFVPNIVWPRWFHFVRELLIAK